LAFFSTLAFLSGGLGGWLGFLLLEPALGSLVALGKGGLTLASLGLACVRWGEYQGGHEE